MATANAFSNLTGQQFMSLTTYRKTGVAVPTPVWFVDVGDRLLVTTDNTTGKVKRLRNNAQVTVAPSKADGTVTGAAVEAQARILDPAEHEPARQALKKKYGIQWHVFMFLGRVRGRKGQTTFLEITPGG
ncbi:PPOX class F420-dependent oxidoreductase [Chloroflexota bacterium]